MLNARLNNRPHGCRNVPPSLLRPRPVFPMQPTSLHVRLPQQQTGQITTIRSTHTTSNCFYNNHHPYCSGRRSGCMMMPSTMSINYNFNSFHGADQLLAVQPIPDHHVTYMSTHTHHPVMSTRSYNSYGANYPTPSVSIPAYQLPFAGFGTVPVRPAATSTTASNNAAPVAHPTVGTAANAAEQHQQNPAPNPEAPEQLEEGSDSSDSSDSDSDTAEAMSEGPQDNHVDSTNAPMEAESMVDNDVPVQTRTIILLDGRANNIIEGAPGHVRLRTRLDLMLHQARDGNTPCYVCGADSYYLCFCKTVFYCSHECEARHWPTHRAECNAIRAEQERFVAETRARVQRERARAQRVVIARVVGQQLPQLYQQQPQQHQQQPQQHQQQQNQQQPQHHQQQPQQQQ